MDVITTANKMSSWASKQVEAGRTIGFVPTMGALHEGHAALIKNAKSKTDVVVVSVFVNPKQFNQLSDLEKYPRTFENDQDLLEKLGVDAMFYPSVDEVYPTESGESENYDLDGLDELMEGPNRPGHFNGVVQVVMRLFDLTTPTAAFFGEKDFQQLTVIRHMTNKLGYEVDVIGCTTVREVDGLAMSSRNRRLSKEGRKLAPIIYKTLKTVRENITVLGVNNSLEEAVSYLDKFHGLELEYLELVDPNTLKRCSQDSKKIQACLAAWVDGVRLIDNMRVK